MCISVCLTKYQIIKRQEFFFRRHHQDDDDPLLGSVVVRVQTTRKSHYLQYLNRKGKEFRKISVPYTPA